MLKPPTRETALRRYLYQLKIFTPITSTASVVGGYEWIRRQEGPGLFFVLYFDTKTN